MTSYMASRILSKQSSGQENNTLKWSSQSLVDLAVRPERILEYVVRT